MLIEIDEESESIEDEKENFQRVKSAQQTRVLRASNVGNLNFTNIHSAPEKNSFNLKIGSQKLNVSHLDLSLGRSSSSDRSPLQEKCESLMAKKLNDFLDVSLFGEDNSNSTHLLSIKESIFKTAYLKIMNLLNALFTHNKIAWLNTLFIQNPTGEQLDYIETLQRELRKLQKEPLPAKIPNEELEKFVLRVFRVISASNCLANVLFN
jgi:hypothetical protein